MSRRRRGGWLFGAGLLGGAAIGYYLNSAAGKQWQAKAKSEFKEYSEEINGIATEAGKLANNYAKVARRKTEELAEQALEKAQAYSEKAKKAATEGSDWANKKAEDLKSSFEAGFEEE